jgi:hypothetical protein
MTSRNVAGSHDRCYPRVIVELGTSVAAPDRRDPVARTGELEASARDLLAVVEGPFVANSAAPIRSPVAAEGTNLTTAASQKRWQSGRPNHSMRTT